MLKSLLDPLRSLSRMQLMVGGLVLFIVILLIVGTINQATVPEVEAPAIGLQSQSFLVLAFLAFAGGLLSFLSPCTLPILPAYFAFAFQSGRRQIAANTIAFMLGLATMFSLLGAGASAIGKVLHNSAAVILLAGGAAVLILGVMSLLGKGFTGFQPSNGNRRNASLGGSFVFGLTFAVGWSSCVGPILGTVLTLAATTTYGSVLRGGILLFIYALGLGLPLVIVSTLFGAASRQSFVWRILRGKGWQITVPRIVIGLVWALAVWRILVAIVRYVFFDALFAGEFTALYEFGLLVVALVGVVVWIFTSSGERQVDLHLHSTQLASGILFIVVGFLMLDGQLTTFNRLVPPDLAVWFIDIEDKLIALFSGG